MSRPNKAVVWLVLVGVFLAGGVAGGFLSLRVAKTLIERGRGPEQFSMRMMKRLTDGLELSDAQRDQIKPIIDATWKSLREYRHQSIDAMRSMESEIMAVLTPAQKAHYAEMQEQQRERWRRLSEQRRGGGGPGGHDGEGRGPPPPGPDGEPPQGMPPPPEPPSD